MNGEGDLQSDGEEEVGNYRLVNLTSISGKTLEQIIKQSLCNHLENYAITTRSQHGFGKNKSSQTNLITFLLGNFPDRWNAVDIIYHDFSNASDKVPNDILTRKLIRCGLDKNNCQVGAQ